MQFNKVHGFYIEVTSSGLDRVPGDYLRRQTLKNAERFITPELKTFEDKALSAQERALALRSWLYEQVLDQLQPHLEPLTALARGLASWTRWRRWPSAPHAELVPPSFVKEPCIDIEAAAIRWSRRVWPRPAPASSPTTAGSMREPPHAGDHRPEHGRQSDLHAPVALIVLLLAMGSFVPAKACRLGPIDAIHTRIGAADDLANAQSTFMLEMTEAAAIVHGRPHSLVLMDEIGRGTSTFDGLALAGHRLAAARPQQVLHALRHHYFELTEWPVTSEARSTCTCPRWRAATTSCSCTTSRAGRRAAATACRWRGWRACLRA